MAYTVHTMGRGREMERIFLGEMRRMRWIGKSRRLCLQEVEKELERTVVRIGEFL